MFVTSETQTLLSKYRRPNCHECHRQHDVNTANCIAKYTLYVVNATGKVRTILVVRSGGRGLRNLFTAVANHDAPSLRGDMILHSREQVSKSPAT